MVLGRAYELGRSTYQATPKYITCCLIFHCKYLSRAGSCAIEQSVWVTKTELDLNKRLKLNWNLFSTTYIPIQFGSLNEPALYLECAFRCRRFRHINKLVDSPPKILISIQWIHQGYIQGRQTEWKLTSATSRLFDYEIKKKRNFRDFWYFETKKVTSAMARWHWLEWRPCLGIIIRITHLNLLPKKILLGVPVEHLARLIHVRSSMFPG